MVCKQCVFICADDITSPLPPRLKFKQESAALRTELQKHQLESKTGNKGLELATKELEATK